MAPDQEQAVQRWTEGAWDALDTAERLFESRKFHHALFFCHLAVEKALKSRYIATHNSLPPYTHDLALLASRIPMALTAEQQRSLAQLSAFNIAARYEEEKLDLYRKATAEYAQDWTERAKALLGIILS